MILDRNANFHIFFQNLVNLVVIFRPFSVCIYQYNIFFFKNAVFMNFFLSTWNLTSKLLWDTFICTGDQFYRSKLIFENRPKSKIFWDFFQNFPSIFKIQRSLGLGYALLKIKIPFAIIYIFEFHCQIVCLWFTFGFDISHRIPKLKHLKVLN